MASTTFRSSSLRTLVILALPWAACSFAQVDNAPSLPPETLKAAVRKAVESNPEVQSRWHAFRAAGEERDGAFGAYLPRIDLTAGVGRERRSDPTIQSEYHRDSSSLTLTQMLYDGFATRNEVRRLDNTRMVRLFELQDATETAALEVARAYLDVLRYRRLVELAEENYVRHRAVFEQIESKVKAGVGRRVDLEQAAGRMALAEANLLTETSNLHDVSARYQRLVGSPPLVRMEVPPKLDKGLPETLVGALGLARQRHPALLAAIENVRAADAAVEASNAAHQPRLDFRLRRDGGANLNGTLGGSTSDVAEFVLTYNLYKGGADQARTRQRAEERNVARDLRDKVCRDTRQTLAIAYNDTRKLGEQLVYLDRHQLSTEKARDAYRKQFDIGQRSLLDLLDSENELFQARRAYANAEIDLDLARIRSHAGLGSLLVALDLSRREAEQLPQEAPTAEEGAEKCPPEAPQLYITDKAVLDGRAQELIRESLNAPPAPASAAAAPSGEPVRIAAAVRAWVAAWSERNVAAYLDAYAPDFEPADGVSRAAWTAARQRIIERAGNITISVADLKVDQSAADRASVSFRQDYRSASYSDSVVKTLEMRLLAGRWLITRETARKVT